MSTQQSQYGPAFGRGVTRERVRDLHAKGLTNVQIARVLQITREAVRQHVKRITAEEEHPA